MLSPHGPLHYHCNQAIELWLFLPKIDLPKAVSLGCKSICPVTHSILQHGLSEMFLLSLDSIAVIVKKGFSNLKDLIDLDNHIRDTKTEST